MISRIEALNFRCLRYVSQPVGPFHVLVGANASGKTTFLDVVALLGRLVSDGLDAAVDERTSNFRDLVWGRAGDRFELAIEARIPDERRKLLKHKDCDTVRYEVALGIDPPTQASSILSERVFFVPPEPTEVPQRTLFPQAMPPPASLLAKKRGGLRTTVSKGEHGNDNFYSEVHPKSGKGWVTNFKLGSRKSALGNLPEDPTKFPVATWLKELLTAGVQSFVLDSLRLRRASPPNQGPGFKLDGSNLPWVIADLEKRTPERLANWVEHLRTALPEIEAVRTVERPDDRHRYLMVRYRGGLEVPSWMASDGTLRLFALTLPAYLQDSRGVYLIEEPENGIHPRAVETVYKSLSSVYKAQVLVATHSPVILSMVKPEEVLCFAKTEDGASDIVLGSEHPALQNWRGETNFGTLYVGGVLG